MRGNRFRWDKMVSRPRLQLAGPTRGWMRGAGLEARTTAGLPPHGPPGPRWAPPFPPVRGDPGLETLPGSESGFTLRSFATGAPAAIGAASAGFAFVGRPGGTVAARS